MEKSDLDRITHGNHVRTYRAIEVLRQHALNRSEFFGRFLREYAEDCGLESLALMGHVLRRLRTDLAA